MVHEDGHKDRHDEKLRDSATLTRGDFTLQRHSVANLKSPHIRMSHLYIWDRRAIEISHWPRDRDCRAAAAAALASSNVKFLLSLSVQRL